MNLLERIQANAKSLNKCIVLPEGLEERTMTAANECLKEGIARIKLIGNPAEILLKANQLGLTEIKNAILIDPKDHEKKEAYIEKLVELRKSKGMTRDEAGHLAGAMNTTGDVLRPAFQIVKTLPGITVVSGAFFMILKDHNFGNDGLMVFADCAVHPNPTDKELAEIAVTTARTTRAIAGIEPRIAMLSFSTKGSAKHEMCEKVIRATQYAKEMDPSLIIDGEMQADAAIIPSVGCSKAPGSEVAGRANVLIFPSLEVGNIAYKLVQRFAHADAIGPVLQGMAAPINDLSRGCSVSDIVNLIAITANQAGGKLSLEPYDNK